MLDHAKATQSSNNAGVVGNRVILGALKARKQNYILALNEDYLAMYADI